MAPPKCKAAVRARFKFSGADQSERNKNVNGLIFYFTHKSMHWLVYRATSEQHRSGLVVFRGLRCHFSSLGLIALLRRDWRRLRRPRRRSAVGTFSDLHDFKYIRIELLAARPAPLALLHYVLHCDCSWQSNNQPVCLQCIHNSQSVCVAVPHHDVVDYESLKEPLGH